MLIWRLTAIEVFRFCAIAAMAAVLALSIRNFGIREWWLAVASGVFAAALALTAEAPGAAFLTALDQAAFLMAFIFLLAMLQEAASTSRSVAEFGAFLTSQPPGRRFGALFLGTNGMSVLFNLGAVNLLTPLVRRGLDSRSLPRDLRAISERRQISAILRGFAWNVVWSPTAIAPLALLELMDGIDRRSWTAMGLLIAIIMFIAGWAEDRLTARRLLAGRTFAGGAPRFPLRAFAGFLSVVTALFTCIWIIVAATGDSIAAGLMVACPALMLLWLLAQTRCDPHKAARMAKDVFTNGLPRLSLVATTLAFSGFLGRVGAELTPVVGIADALNLYDAPDALLLGLLPILLAALSFLGVSPIMLAVFFGSFFGGLPIPPADPTLIALAISCGWSMAMLLSPYATVVMLLAQHTGERGLRVAAGWNGAYAAICALLLLGFFTAVVA